APRRDGVPACHAVHRRGSRPGRHPLHLPRHRAVAAEPSGMTYITTRRVEMRERAPGCSLVHWVRHHAEREPSRPFVQEIGGESLTYGDALAGSDVWTRGLSAVAISDGTRVAIMLP